MTRTNRWAGLAALVAVALSGPAAYADINIQDGNPNTVVTFNYTCPPAAQASEVVINQPGNFSALRTYCTFPNQITMRADKQGSKVGSYVIARGNSSGGGLGTMALNDSVYAEDSIAVNIGRNTTTNQVTLTFQFGRMLLNPGNDPRASNSKIKVLVYQNDAAANADPARLGQSAAFQGTVKLSSTGITMFGGFSGSDWVFSTAGAQSIATVQTNLAKIVNVASAANAAVVVISDPSSGTALEPLPVTQPVGIGIITVLLLASGLWFMRTRAARTA